VKSCYNVVQLQQSFNKWNCSLYVPDNILIQPQPLVETNPALDTVKSSACLCAVLPFHVSSAQVSLVLGIAIATVLQADYLPLQHLHQPHTASAAVCCYLQHTNTV